MFWRWGEKPLERLLALRSNEKSGTVFNHRYPGANRVCITGFTMKKTILTAIALALAASASTVHAHDDAYLDTQKAPMAVSCAWRASITWNWCSTIPARRSPTSPWWCMSRTMRGKNLHRKRHGHRDHSGCQGKSDGGSGADGDNRLKAWGVCLNPRHEGGHHGHRQKASP